MEREWTVADFDYELPPDRIAQEPVEPADGARMMVVHVTTGEREDRFVRDLPEYLRAGDVLVVNDTRVIPARQWARRSTGGRVEVLWVEELSDGTWLALVRPRQRVRVGEVLHLGSGTATARVMEHRADGMTRLQVNSPVPLLTLLEREGHVPLPPYIRRASPGERPEDRRWYQTVFARRDGSVAAPTAGLHFTPELLQRLEAAGVHRVAVTLHVGPGTFRPVKVERLDQHRMHEEPYEVSDEAAVVIHEARARGGRICAVGTTVTRVLETVADPEGRIRPGHGRTDLFIRPPWQFRAVDLMLTNFHLPRSTLLMLVCAFGGRDLVLEAYREAIAKRYRFFSYGDAMLLIHRER